MAVRSGLPVQSSDYLRRLWFDTVLWAPKAIRLLISFVGRERVALGSDYPFGFSMWPPLGEEVLGVKMLLHVPGIPTLRGTWRNPIKGLASRTVGGTAGTPVMVEPS